MPEISSADLLPSFFFQCDPMATTVGEIVISLPRPSKVREYQVDVAMDEQCHAGMAVYCRQMCGIGPHLVQMLSHVKYKAENDQVRSLQW